MVFGNHESTFIRKIHPRQPWWLDRRGPRLQPSIECGWGTGAILLLMLIRYLFQERDWSLLSRSLRGGLFKISFFNFKAGMQRGTSLYSPKKSLFSQCWWSALGIFSLSIQFQEKSTKKFTLEDLQYWIFNKLYNWKILFLKIRIYFQILLLDIRNLEFLNYHSDLEMTCTNNQLRLYLT